MAENWISVKDSEEFCELDFKVSDNEVKILLDESDVMYLLKELMLYSYLKLERFEVA